MDDSDRVRRRKALGRLEQPVDGGGTLPEPGRFQLLELLARLRHAGAHIRPPVPVGRQLVGDLGVVEPAQETRERTPDLHAGRVVQRRLAELAPGQELAAEERPREASGGPADEDRRRHWDRQQGRQFRQDSDLAPHAGHRDLAARKAKRPELVDEPDRVVPALRERSHRLDLELRKLR